MSAPGPAVQDGLGGGDGEHEIGLHESRMDASLAGDGDERVVLGVVDDDSPAERPGLRRGENAFEVALAEPASEPARHEDGLAFVRHAAALELRHGHGDRRLPSVLRCAGQRERRRLDEDRRSSAWCDERCPADRRRAESGAHRGRLPRRRRPARAGRADAGSTSSSLVGTRTTRDPESSGTRRTAAIQPGRRVVSCRRRSPARSCSSTTGRRTSPSSSSSTGTTSRIEGSSRFPRSSRRPTVSRPMRCSASRTCSSSSCRTTRRGASRSRGTPARCTERRSRPSTSQSAGRCRISCVSSSRTSARSSRRSAIGTSSSRAGRRTT